MQVIDYWVGVFGDEPELQGVRVGHRSKRVLIGSSEECAYRNARFGKGAIAWEKLKGEEVKILVESMTIAEFDFTMEARENM